MVYCTGILQERLNNIGPEEFIQTFVKNPDETEVCMCMYSVTVN